MEIDSSDNVNGRVFSQLGEDRLLYPYVFFSKI